MTTPSNTVPDSLLDAPAIAAAEIPPTRLLYWSIRRELWENPLIYIAPLGVAAVVLFAFSISAILGIWESALRLGSPHGGDKIAMPYDLAAGLMMLTSILVSVFYCLDALHGERRDRSILFWKSLPVSDLTTVLAKASIPLVVLPLLVCVIIIAVQWIMLLVSSAVLLVRGQSVAAFWTQLSFFRMAMVTLYHLVTAHALWPFPVYCWLLLVSGWARRATFLWAALPLIAIAGVEQIVFHTWHFAQLVGSRLIGNTPTPGDVFPTGPMTHITPGVFLTSPDLWIGFAISATFLAAAVRLRRYQGPI